MKTLHSAWFAGILALTVPAALAMSVRADDKPAAAKTQRVRGRIVRVQDDGRQLTVKPLLGDKEVTVQVDDSAKVRQKGRDVKLSQFKAGDRVIVTYEVGDGKNKALTINEAVTLDEVRRKTVDALDAVKAFTFQQKEEYQKKLEVVVKDLDHQIDDLKERAKDAKEEAKKQYAQELEELRKRRDALQERLAKAKAATPDAWEDVKGGVNRALDEVQKALDKARTRFKEP